MEDKPKTKPKKGKRKKDTCFTCYLTGHKRRYCKTDMEKLDEEVLKERKKQFEQRKKEMKKNHNQRYRGVRSWNN